MPPFLEGYLGFGRREKLALFLGAAASAIVTFLLVLRPLMARLGDVRVLQLSLGFSALFPALLAACTDVWQVMLLSFLLAGPLLVSVPVVSAIKSNLVAADEQGLVQGAIASIGRGSATVGFLFFGYLFRGATHRGELSSWSSVRGPFLAMAAVGLAAFLAALPLGDMPRAAREAPAALELAGLRRHRDAEEPPGSAPAPCAEVIGPPFEPGT